MALFRDSQIPIRCIFFDMKILSTNLYLVFSISVLYLIYWYIIYNLAYNV